VQGGLPFPSFLARLLVPYNDHGIQIPAEFIHRRRKPFDMRLREIALVWRGLDQIDREGGEDLPMAAEGVLVGSQDAAAVGLDGLGQTGHGGGWRARGDGVRRDAAGAGLGCRFLLAPWLPLTPVRGMLGCLGLGHWDLV
jgi:hypothetical protein